MRLDTSIFAWDKLSSKHFFAAIAILIAIGTLLASNYLVRDLAENEKNDMGVWAEAMRTLNNADESTDLNLVLKIINSNQNIPVIVQDANGDIITHRNINGGMDAADSSYAESEIKTLATRMQREGYVMKMYLTDSIASPDEYIMVSYGESNLLKRLAYFPYIILFTVAAFCLLAFIAIINAKRAEQNKVWVGLSKETAHQLGTPISSLMGWVEVLCDSYPDDELIPELGRDVERLQLVAERFSKIGSAPEMQTTELQPIIHRVADYIAKRAPRGMQVDEVYPKYAVRVNVNVSLLEWVIENICKNGIDAMQGKGVITLTLGSSSEGNAFIEIEDTGKGISKKDFKTIFSPGYTTKKRGWGLGLSLAKRIVEEYHGGKIFVKQSEIGVGTTFRIEL